MNKSTIIFITSFLFLISCSQENDVLNELNDKQTINKDLNLNNRSNSVFGETTINFDENLFHSVSLLISKTILNNSEAKDYFLQVLDNNHQASVNTIQLEELLSTTFSNNVFYNAFRTEYFYYYGSGFYYCGKPEEEEEPPTLEKGLYAVQESSFQFYLNSILNENCIELYFPNGINEEYLNFDFPIIISSAHPFTNLETNESYVNPIGCRLEKSEVNSTTLGNIIIARPNRAQLNQRRCTYSEYSFIEDFTEFLAN